MEKDLVNNSRSSHHHHMAPSGPWRVQYMPLSFAQTSKRGQSYYQCCTTFTIPYTIIIIIIRMIQRTLLFRSLFLVLSLASFSSGFLLPQRQHSASNSVLVLGNPKIENDARAPFLSPSADTACAPLRASGTSSTGDDATIIDADFRLAGIFLVGGLLLDQLPILKFTLGPIITLLGVLFLVQTFRLKFVCDSTAFALQNTSKESGENIVVGGENRWDYNAFVNYEFFPKGWIDQPQGPILVYFKETQTPSDKWKDGPGASANSDEALAKGAKPGQVHFFPALCNCQQLQAEWERRGCTKL